MKARNVVEWAVLVTSVLAIAAVVAILVIEGLGPTRPADPQLELRSAEARQTSSGWVVPASVTNRGDEPIERVVYEATATVGGREEVSELQIPFLPEESEVEVAFSFSAQPDGEVTVRLVGWGVP